MISWARPGILSRERPLYSILILVNVLLASFLTVFASVATIIASSSIQGSLALSDTMTVWLTTINLLGANSMVPAGSSLGDRFGYKKMFAIGLILFALSTVLVATAENVLTILVGRLIEGLGTGLIFPVGLSLIVQNTTPKQRPLALILYMAAIFGGGFAFGLPFSAYLTQFASWRSIFYLIFILSVLSILICWLTQEETERKNPLKFDTWGFLSFIGFFAFILIAMTMGPLRSTDAGWRSPLVIACFVLGVLCLITMISIELRNENPVIPLKLFANPIFTVGSIGLFLLGMSLFGSATAMMDYMINALAYEKYVSGKIGIIYGVSLTACSILSSALMKLKIPVSFLTFAGLMLLIYSYFLNNELDRFTGPDQISWILLLRGAGLGLALGPTTVQAMACAPQELKDKAATLLTFFRQSGATYGGTLVVLVTIKRKIFHAARFGEQANEQLPAFKVVFQKMFTQFSTKVTEGSQVSAAATKAELVRNIELQSFIQATNDAMIVLGVITACVSAALLFFNFIQLLKRRSFKRRQTLDA